jgi:acid phosphatase (class A)
MTLALKLAPFCFAWNQWSGFQIARTDFSSTNSLMMKFPRRTLALFSLSVLALAGPWSRAQEMATKAVAPKAAKAPFATHFAKPASVDCAKVLPPPPAPGTLSARADLEAVLQAQAWRTPDQVAWAKQVDKNDAFMSSEVIGSWFKRENLPLTAAFLKDVDEDRHEITEVAKMLFARARPWVVDDHVQPCVNKPTNDSYPSGHCTSIFTRAAVLAEIFPEKRAALFDFAHRAAWGRVYAGVHYPSDLVGGWMLADSIVAEITKSPAFQERLKAVRAEVARYKEPTRKE